MTGSRSAFREGTEVRSQKSDVRNQKSATYAEQDMTRDRSTRCALIVVCLVFVAAGCGATPVPVKGIVTLDTKPLPNASVMFIPQEPGGKEATGYTDGSGAFELTTSRLKDGALPGLYKVTVRYSESVTVPSSLKTAEEVQAWMAKAASKKSSVVLPDIYARPDMTVLKHRVPDDGDVKLELKSAKR